MREPRHTVFVFWLCHAGFWVALERSQWFWQRNVGIVYSMYVCVYIYAHTRKHILTHGSPRRSKKNVIQQKPMVFNLFVQKWIFTVPAHILQIHHVGCCAHFFPSCAVILSHYSIARWFQNLKLKMWKGGEQAPKKFPYAARKSAFTRCSVRGKECDFGMLADVGRYPLVN